MTAFAGHLLRKSMRLAIVAATAAAAFGLQSCREDDIIFIPEEVPVTTPEYTSVTGFYLLNEGNMGSNKCTLDYFDYSTGVYTRNIYGIANPDVPKELGDVGNDIAVYGSRLYAVVNCSNKVEVMDAATARRIGQVEIPNCRSIKFDGEYAYVTSYAGPVVIDPDYKQKGYVAKVNLATLEVEDRCIVGFQPDGLEIVNGKIYVCNSGGYTVPNYENTLSVIDLATFREERRIEIAINLDGIVADRRGRLWISSRGDYYNTPPRIYCYDTRKQRIEHALDIPANSMALCDDLLYVVSSTFNYGDATKDYVGSAIIDTETGEVTRQGIITDGSETQLRKPYGIAVNPETHEIFITDVRTYVNPGYLYCYTPEGEYKWRVRTGDIPAHFAFTGDRK